MPGLPSLILIHFHIFTPDTTNGIQQRNVISIADILTSKVDFDDDYEQKDEKIVGNDGEETSNVSFVCYNGIFWLCFHHPVNHI